MPEKFGRRTTVTVSDFHFLGRNADARKLGPKLLADTVRVEERQGTAVDAMTGLVAKEGTETAAKWTLGKRRGACAPLLFRLPVKPAMMGQGWGSG